MQEINRRSTEEKIVAVYVTNIYNRVISPKCTINIEGRRIPRSNEEKYLSIILDKKLTYRQHIKEMNKRENYLMKKLYSFMNRKGNLTAENIQIREEKNTDTLEEMAKRRSSKKN